MSELQDRARSRERRPYRAARQVAAGLGLLLAVALAGCTAASPSGSRPPVVTIAPVADAAVTAGEPLRFDVHAKPAPSTALTVKVTITSSPCELPSPKSVTIAAGISQVPLTIATSRVAVDASGCVVTATIDAGDGYEAGETAASVRATIEPSPPSPPQPVVTIAAGDSPVVEGSPVSFTLTATPPPASELAVTVTWSQSGLFLEETEETLSSATVTIPVTGMAPLPAETENDDVDEENGSVTVAVAAGSGYAVGTPNSATVDVTDDDPADTTTPGPTTPGPTTPGPSTGTPSPPEVNIYFVTVDRNRASSPCDTGAPFERLAERAVEMTDLDAFSFIVTATPPPEADLTETIKVHYDDPHGVLHGQRISPSSGTWDHTIKAHTDFQMRCSRASVDDGEAPRTVTLTVKEGSGYVVGSDSMVEITVSDSIYD